MPVRRKLAVESSVMSVRLDLLRSFLAVLLREREALRFLAAGFAFPDVVSALAISHKILTLACLSQRSNGVTETRLS